MVSLIGKLFNSGFQGKLENLIAHHEKTGWSMGRNIYITIKAQNTGFSFSVNVNTNDGSLVGLFRSCEAYNSRQYPDLNSIFIDIT